MTVSNTGAQLSGAYTINVVGTSGALTHNLNVTLNVSNGVSAAPSLTSPANAAIGVATTPSFTWAASPGAASYEIQVASDAAFTNIVASATSVTATNWTSNVNLGTNTQYFWRVRGFNPCGNGAFSSGFSFTTACIVTASYTGPAVAIPDNVPAGVNINIPVSGVGTVSDIDFRFDTAGACDATLGNVNSAMDHTFIGDLTFKLTPPDGSPTVTFQARRGGTSENICLTNINDDGGFPNISTLPATSGTFETGNFSPETTGMLSMFDGENANGTWVLNVSDNAGADTGSMRRFSLLLSGSSTCTAGTPTPTSTGTPAPTFTSTPTATATATPTGSPCGGTPVTIAANAGSLGPVVDNNPAAPRNVTFTVSGLPAGALADVQADFTMNPVHTWGGDIDATLIAPDGTQFVMFASTGATTATGVGDSSDLSGPYVFTDSAAGTNWWAAAATAGTAEVIPPGSYRTTQAGPQGAANFSPPTNLTAAFAGVANPNGTWTMRFTDNAAGDTGAVSAANLRLTGTGTCSSPTPTSTGTPATPTATSTSTPAPSASCTPVSSMVLYDQSGSAGGNATTSQDFEAASDAFDSRAADDFVVPAGQTWTVQRIVADGLYFNGSGPADSFNVTFYANTGGFPGTAVAGGTLTGATYTNTTTQFTINLPSSVVLPAGTYWVSVQARMDFTPGGQWGWTDRTATTNSAAAWQNPGGGFSLPACTGWARRGATCGLDAAAPDQVFQIVGLNGTGGGGCSSPTPTSTGTPATPTATATGTPAATSVQFSSVTYTEDESQTAVITINRTGDVSGTTTVNFATSNGTATGGASCTSGVDYITTTQTVTFVPNETLRTATVQICSDLLTEPVQTVNMTLTGANVGTPAAAVLNINDVASFYRAAGAICTNLGGPASPYPSTIAVSGAPASIGSMRVTLFDVAHTSPDSMDFLLVGPGGQKFILMADAGGVVDLITPVTLTFSDAAGQVLPNSAPLTTGIFEPTSWEPGQASFAAPAPPAPYIEPGSTVGGTPSLTSVFGTTNANGTWSLYMRDDAGTFDTPVAVTGCVNGGWGLEFFSATAANASVSGRIVTSDGFGIRNAKVVITGNSLSSPIVATTGSFGYFTFEGLRTGETYVVTVNSQRYTFGKPSRVISLVDNVVDADFTADPQE